MKRLVPLVGISLAIVATMISQERSASAHFVAAPLPSHLSVGSQDFDFTVGGLRAYLEATKILDPALYEQLAPDVEHLEVRKTEAVVAAAAGLTAATALVVYGFTGQATCTAPQVTDPDFAAHTETWAACNESNMRHVATFTLVGMGAVVAGLAAAWAIAPSRADILDVVDKHNRLSPEPLRLQLGYDPASRLGYGGVALTF